MKRNRIWSVAAVFASTVPTLGASALAVSLVETLAIPVPAPAGALLKDVFSVTTDGRRIVAAAPGGTARVWALDKSGGFLLRNEFPADKSQALGSVSVVAASPDGGSILVAGRPRQAAGAAGRSVAVIGELGTVRTSLNPLVGRPAAVAVEHKGKRVAVADGERVRILSPENKSDDFGKRAKLSAVAWPDDTIVTGDGDGLLSLWDPTALGDAKADIDLRQPVVGLASYPSATGSYFVAGSDGAIRIVDTSRATPAAVASGTVDTVSAASGQAGVLALGGIDAASKTTIATWSGSGAAKTLTLTASAARPLALGLSGDGGLVGWVQAGAGNAECRVTVTALPATAVTAETVPDVDVKAVVPLPGPPILLVVGHASGKIEVVNTGTHMIDTLVTVDPVAAMAPHPDLSHVYVADTKKKVLRRDAVLKDDGTVKMPAGIPVVLALSTSKTYLAAGTEKGSVLVWPHDKIDQLPVFRFEGPPKEVTSLAVIEDPGAPDNAFVVVGFKDGTGLLVVDLKTQRVRQALGIAPAKVAGLAGSGGGPPGVFAGTIDKTLQALPVAVTRVLSPSASSAKVTALVSDDESVYAGFDDGKILSFDGSGNAKPYTVLPSPATTNEVVALAIAGTGSSRTLFALHKTEAVVRSGTTASALIDVKRTLTAPATSLAPLAGGRFLALGSAGSEIAVHDLSTSTNTPLLSLFGSLDFGLLTPTADGLGLAATSGTENRASVWRVLSPNQGVFSVVASDSHVFATSWLGAERVVLGGDTSIRVFDLAGNLKFSQPRTKAVLSIAASPDATLIASGGNDKLITLWNDDLTTPRTFTPPTSPATTPPTPDLIKAVAFDSDSKRLASGSGTTVTVWDSAAGTLTKIASDGAVHKKAVNSVAFSKDGKFLASLDADGTLVVWDFSVAGALTKVKSIDAPGYIGHQVVWLEDGAMLAVGASDGKVHVFTFTH